MRIRCIIEQVQAAAETDDDVAGKPQMGSPSLPKATTVPKPNVSDAPKEQGTATTLFSRRLSTRRAPKCNSLTDLNGKRLAA